jgi:hypothetical protein
MNLIETTKWVGTAALVAATTLRSLNLSHTGDVALTLVGVTLWLVVGLRTRDRALSVVNGFSVAILAFGLIVAR